jgi:hypothetical protein
MKPVAGWQGPSVERLYRTRMSGQWVALCGAPEDLLLPDAAHVGWAAMAVLLDQPFGVVAGDEGPDGLAHLRDGLEDATMDDLFFQGAEEALYASVRLGLADGTVARLGVVAFWRWMTLTRRLSSETAFAFRYRQAAAGHL